MAIGSDAVPNGAGFPPKVMVVEEARDLVIVRENDGMSERFRGGFDRVLEVCQCRASE